MATLRWLVVLSLLLTGCGVFQRGREQVIKGSGQVATETRAIGPLTRVALEGLGDVIVQQGSTDMLTLSAEDNLLPLITSETDGDTLRLNFSRPDWRSSVQPTKPIQYMLTISDLQAFDLAGSGSLHAADINTDHLLINLTGQGDVTIDHLDTGELTVRLGGSGHVTVAGRAISQAVQLSGKGEYQAGGLESQAATVELSGSGDVVVWVRSDLSVNITGAGSVSYFGQPALSRRDISGAGDINPMGEK